MKKNKVCFIILFLGCVSIMSWAEDNESSAYIDAWALYNKGASEQVLEIIKKYNRPESPNRDGWYVLLGSVYLRQEKFEEALEAINTVRSRIEKAYNILLVKPYILSEKDREGISELYNHMITRSRIINFKLEKWSEAIHDYFIYAKKHDLDANDYYFLAICYYKTSDYVKARDAFINVYQMDNDMETKIESAYNIGALNAVLGNVDETVKWLKIPLDSDKKTWLPKIKKDKDFDSIRDNKQFVEFLKQQE